jgi:outer membrane protein
MKFKKTFLFLIVVPIATLPFMASAKTYSLKEIVKRYVEQSPEIKSAKSQYTASHYLAKQSTSKFFPTISLNGSITDYKNPTISAFPGIATTGKQYKGTLDLVQPLFAGGALWRGMQVGQLNKAMQEQNYLNVKQESIAGIILASYQLASLKDQIKILEESQKYQERFYNLTKGKASRGAAKTYELAQAKADFLSYSPRIENLKQQVRDAEESIRVSLQLEDNDPIDIQLSSVKKVERLQMDKVLEQATRNRPKIKMSEIAVELAQENKWLNLAEDLPSLSFVAQTGYQSPNQEDFSKETTRLYAVGVQLKIPLFSGLSSVHKYQSGAENVRSAEEALASARNSLKIEIQKTVESLDTTQRLIAQSEEWVTEARKALNASIDSYRSGTITSVQVIQVQRSWEQAEISLIGSRTSFLTALLTLRKAMGTDLEQVYVE